MADVGVSSADSKMVAIPINTIVWIGDKGHYSLVIQITIRSAENVALVVTVAQGENLHVEVKLIIFL